MANSIEENLAFLQAQQGKAQQVLQDYESKSNIMLGKPKAVAAPTPVSPYNQLDFESKSNVQQRIDTIAPESKIRDGSDIINDTGTTLAQAYVNFSRGLAGTLAMTASPLLAAANAIQGKPIQSTAQNIESFDEWMGYGDTKAKLSAWESPKLQQIRADGAAIDNNPNLSETERFTEKMKYWGSNPVTALMDGAGEVVKSGAEMALFGGIAKTAGITSTAGRVFAGSSVPGATNHVLGIIDDPDAEVTSKTLPTAFAVGAMTGASAGIAQKFNPFDLERWIAGGTVGKMAANRPAAMALGGLGEGVEESIQGPASEVLANREKGRPLTAKLGSTVADSAAIGYASGVVGGSHVPINRGVADSQSVTDALTERADREEAKRREGITEQLDMSNEKSAPVRVFKQSLYDLKSSDSEVREFAAQTIERASNAVESRRHELEEQISKETDESAKAELTATYNEFMGTKYNPLKAEIKNYISSEGSTESIGSFTASLDAAKKNREKLFTQTSGKKVNIDNLLEEIANSSYESGTPTTAIANTSNKKSNLAMLIERGESSARGHADINFGTGKRKGNTDPTKLTVGQISDGLSKGDFVAVGKYQMHKSSFDEMRKNLSWVNKDTVFTPEVQDRIFVEHYIGKKRKNLAGYIRGENNDLKKAHNEFANEWVSAEGFDGQQFGGKNNKATLKASEVSQHLREAREIYKSLIDKGASPEAALRTAVMFDLDEPSTAGSASTATGKVDSSRDARFKNRADYGDLKLKSNESIGGKNGAVGHTIDFAHVIQKTIGDDLIHFSGFDDTYARKTVNHSGGKGVDFSIKGAGSSGQGLAKSYEIEKQLYAQAKAQGFNIKVHNEYDPKKLSKGSTPHMHITVVGRTSNAPTNTNTQASGTGEEVSANQSSIKGTPLVGSVNDLIANLDKTMAEFTSDTLEESDLEKSDKVLEEERTRLARVAAAKGDVDPETAKVLFSTAQQEVLRTMDAVKLEMANLRNVSKVSKDILDGDQNSDPDPMKSHIGLKQYYDIINQSIATGDTDTANKYLGWLERFANSHQSKREAFVAFGDQTSTTNRITIAPNEMGDWVRIDPTEYTKEELDKARATEVRGKNALYNAVNAEADAINNAYKALSDGSSQFLEGITPYVAPVNTGASVSTSVTPVETPATPPQGKPPVKPTTPSTPADIADPTPVETPVTTKFNGLKGGFKEMKSKHPDGFYAGMASTSDNKLVSLNQTSENTIGNDGWLGHVKPVRATEPDKVHAEALDLYIDKFKEKSVGTKAIEGFIPQLQKDLAKPIYGYEGSNKYSETAFLGELSERIQGMNTQQVTDLVGRIKGYDPEKGLLLEVATYDESAPKDPKATYLTDDSFGFNDKNKYDLSTISDENLAANKNMIDKVLEENTDALFPSKGLGQALRGSAPKTFQYLNQTIQDNLGVDNKQMVLDNPDMSNPENKKRSVYESQKNSKTNVGKASAPIKETKEANEKDKKSQLSNKSYTNQYLHTDNAGNDTIINIARDDKTNAITEVKVMQNGKVNTISKIPEKLSDNRVVNNLTEKLKLDNAIEHVDLSSVSVETEEDTPMAKVGKVSVPKALVNTPTKVVEVMDKLVDKIDSENADTNEGVLLKSIINPLLNFNPDMKVNISDKAGKTNYDKETNTITLHEGSDSHLVNELARSVVFSSTALLANKLDSEAATNLRADKKELIKLNKEISKLKSDIERLSILGMDSDLSPEVRAKILSSVESNGKLLSLATTDSDIMKYLQSVDTEGKIAKGNTSVFTKIINSVKTFFNIANNSKMSTLYDNLLYLTAKTAELQARNDKVSFKPTEQGKVWLFRDLIKEEVEAELEKPYYERNQLIAIFKQTKTLAKPLSSIPNFASKLKIDLMQGLNTLVKESPTKEQREQVEDFLRFRDELAIHLMDTLKTKPSKEGDARQFAYEDKVKFMVKEDGTVDENVLNTAALAAYDWIIEFGNKTANLDKDIKKLLNLEPDDPAYIPANIREQYIHGLMLKANQANAMGQTATSALGIKATEEGSEAAQSELDNSFGEWIIAAMQSADLIHISTMKSNDHLANITQVGGELKDKAGNELKDNFGKSDVTFISVVDKNGANNNRRLKEVIDASRNTKGYLGKIFGMEIGLRAPVKEKPLTTIAKIRRTFATVSEEQAKLMKRMQEAPMKVSDDSFDGLMHLLKVDRGVTLKMMGAMITDEELAKEHKNNRHSKTSAAEGIYREVENIVDYVGSLERVSDGTREEFYDTQYAAKNNRMHYSSNMVNMQTSKVHRALVEYVNFKTDIDISDLNNGNPQWLNKDGTTNDFGLLLRAIMQNAEGTKDIMKVALKGSTFINSFTEDKLSTEAALNPFYDYLRSDAKVKSAVEAATKLLTNPESVTNKDAEAIAALVNYWGAGTMSYRALLEYTKLNMAMEAGSKTITTTFGMGSDGVNNGTAISQTQLGVATPQFSAQVGIITNDPEYDGINSYLDTRTIPDLGDYYEGLINLLEANKDALNTEMAKAYLALTTSFFERDNSKAILIPFGYNAGLERLKGLAYGQFLEDVTKGLKALSDMDVTSAEYSNAKTAMEQNMSAVTGTEVVLPDGKELLEYWFDSKALNNMKNSHKKQIGNFISKNVKEYAGDFIAERKRNVKMQNASSEAFLAVKKVLVDQAHETYKEWLADSGMYKDSSDTALDKLIKIEGIPQRVYKDLVGDKLDAIRPTIKTPYNHKNESSAADFTVTEEILSLKNNESGRAVSYRVDNEGKLVSASNMIAKGERSEQSTGVVVNSAQVQSSDAYIAGKASAMEGKEDAVSLNIHDQANGGIRNFVDMVKMQNQATYEVLRDYNVQAESATSLTKTLRSMEKLYNDGDIDLETYKSILNNLVVNLLGEYDISTFVASLVYYEDSFKDKYGIVDDKGEIEIRAITQEEYVNDFYPEMIKQAVYALYQTNDNRSDILENIKVVSQYAGVDGQYVVTEADKALIKDSHKFGADATNSLSVALTNALEVLGKEFVRDEQTGEIIEEGIQDSDNEGSNDTTSEVGQEVSLTDFINHLKSNTTDTVGLETADYLVSRIAANNPDVKVLIVPTLGSTKYKGSYTAKDNTIRISQEVLNGLAFRDQLELINHEVMHAATVRAINNASVTGLDMTDPRAQEVLEAAQTLREMLQELRELHGLEKDFTGTSLENLAEFVAYGTTNKVAMATIAKGLTKDYKEVGRPTANKGFTAFLKTVVSMLHKQLGVTKSSKEMKRYEAFARAVDILTKDVAITKNHNLFGDAVLYSTRQGTPAEVLKSLSAPNVSSEFNEHLDSLSDLIVAPSYIGNAVRESILENIIDNVSTKALNAGFVMSDKELHMMEVVKTITIGYLNNHSGTLTAAKLRDSVADALNQLTVNHFLASPSTATVAERKVAQSKLNFLVKLDNVSKDEQVERFLAMASANEEVRNILDTLTMNRKKGTQDTWFGKVMSFIQDIVQWMTDSTLNTKGQNFNEDIDSMMRRLAAIDISAKSTKESIWSSIYNTGTAAISVPTNWAINNLVNGIFSVVDVSGSSNTSIATIGRIIKKARATGTMANIDTAVDEASRYDRQDGSLRLGGFGELLVEISRTSGMKATVEALIRMTNKAGQLRDTVKKATIREINKLFDQDISEIPKEQTDSVTQVALRSDISSLMSNGINVTSTLKLLRDPVARQAEIAKRELRISSNPNASDILLQTKDLALYMAKGETTNFLLKNAESIAIGKDSWYETGLDSMDMQLKADIDVLASLYAVDFTGKDQQAALTELINKEPEAVKAMMQMHQDMVKQSKEEFEDNPYNYIKGYTPNLTHHLRSLMFAEAVLATPGNPGKTQAQVIKELENKGWVVIDRGLKQDSTDNSPERALMFHKDMLYQDYVSGALDMKDSHSKGTTVYDGNSYRDMQRIKSQKLAQRRQRASTMDYLTYDPRRSSKNSLVATYDSEGATISYGYEMSGELRDTYLERNNNAVELLGILQSDLVFKPSIKETQRGVAKSLYQDFIDSYSKDPRLFVTLDPNSTDPEIQKMWKMAPFTFKEEAAKQFGKGNPIVVRKSVFNSVFGFRAFSISEMFEKVTGDKNAVEKIVTSLLSAVLGDKAQMRVLQGERMWQKVITQTKSFIVIRNVQVLIGNVVSNALILALNDVPISQQIKDMVEVWRNGGTYRKQANRVAEIDAAMRINKSRPKELTKLRRERNTAMRAMEQNPMHMFMEAGLMSTIVEDVNIDGEKTGFKSDLELKIEEAQGYLPDQIITAFSWVMMSPGTPAHDFMAHSTQFSDLAAKYSMAKQRMESGKTMEDSIAEAQDTFINYDVPTGKGLDYLNRMGLFMFTKFFLRFQSTLIRTMEKKAGSMIAQHMGIEYFTNLSGVLDPFAMNRIGNNPFEPGILNYDNAVSNISTVNFLTGIFN